MNQFKYTEDFGFQLSLWKTAGLIHTGVESNKLKTKPLNKSFLAEIISELDQIRINAKI